MEQCGKYGDLQRGAAAGFHLHEGLVRRLTAYLASLGIMTYNDTKLGEEPSDFDELLYIQETVETDERALRVCSIKRPFYYLRYKSYDGRTLKKSLLGGINIYTGR